WRDRADPDAGVVAPEPVAEVVPRTQVTPTGRRQVETEVRGLVPAVAGSDESLDDQLEVVLHRLSLALELGSVRVREAGARLRLELVAGQVLRLERERFGEVAAQVGGALTRDAVDEIERDVVKTGITKMVEGAADVARLGAPLQNGHQARLD